MRQGRRFVALLVAVLMAAVTAPAFAEVQNVKVGGDITVRGIWRQDFDLNQDSNFTTTGTGTSDSEKFIFSTVGINLTADLTDNVSADIRLVNQRDWGSNADLAGGDSGLGVDISRAYVTMREILYSPLTIRVGRQPLWFGKGFIVGSRLLAGDAGTDGNFSATEFTDQTGFDAVRATLDYNPVTVDLVYSKITEAGGAGGAGTAASSDDDINLMGANLGFKCADGKGEAEAYYWNQHDQSVRGSSTTVAKGDLRPADVNTIGLRGSIEPVQHTSLWGEAAYQFGTVGGTSDSSQQAFAFDLGGQVSLADATWTPTLGAEWIFYSGAKKDALAGWNPMYRGKFDTLIREFLGGIYATDYPNDNASFTNEHQIALFGGIKPSDSVRLDTRFTWFATDEGVRVGTLAGGKTPHYLGAEWDTKALYDYTEDVQFGLIYGVYWPGAVYRDQAATPASVTNLGGRSTAQELVSTVSVKF